jgi:transcriptional regulator with XRE-family HTH domain
MTPDELKRRREALGMSQTELAAYLGVSYWTYRNWETGRRAPTRGNAVLTDHALILAEDAHRNGGRLPDWKRLLASLGQRVG